MQTLLVMRSLCSCNLHNLALMTVVQAELLQCVLDRLKPEYVQLKAHKESLTRHHVSITCCDAQNADDPVLFN